MEMLLAGPVGGLLHALEEPLLELKGELVFALTRNERWHWKMLAYGFRSSMTAACVV